MSQTLVRYNGAALPTTAAPVTLYDSSLAPVPLILLGLQWYQYAIAMGSAADGASGVVTGQFQNEAGAWTTFYTGATIADGTGGAIGAPVADEVYIGLYRNVRFFLTVSGENTTSFRISQALQCEKSTSKVAAAERLHITPA